MIPKQITGLSRLAVDLQVGLRALRVGLDAGRRSGGRRGGRRRPRARDIARGLRTQAAFLQVLREKKYVRFGDRVYFDAFSPHFPGPVFDDFVASTVRQFAGAPQARAMIPYVVLAITDRCMYRCEHCYASDAIRNKDTLSLEQWKTVVDRFQEVGAGVIGFEGGEPLLRFDDLVALCEHARARSDVWIATTGYGLTPSKARRLADAGLAGAAISLDHYDPDQHNAFRRNKKAFDEAAKAIALFAQAGVFPALSVCATREMLEDDGLGRFLALARELGAGVVQALDPIPAGNYLSSTVSLSTAELRRLQAYQRTVNTARRYRDLPALSTRATLEDDHTFGCGAGGNWIIYVDPAGNLQPCPFLGVTTGNVATDDFAEVLARMRALFPRPAALGVSCPAHGLRDQIADARARNGRLPVPYDDARHICAEFAEAPLPRLFASSSPRPNRV